MKNPIERVATLQYCSTMKILDRIVEDPAVMNGQPCIRGSRLTVRRVLEIVAMYPDHSERLREYPDLDDESIAQAIQYASFHLPDGSVRIDALDALVA